MSTGTNKRTILLDNYNILREDPMSYPEEIKAIILQLCEEDPEAAIKCWSDILRDNIEILKSDIAEADEDGFSYKTFGYHYVNKFEYDIVQKQVFRFAADAFARDKFLLSVLYEYCPVNKDYLSVQYPISYLIRKETLDGAANILDALYKSRSFAKYAKLWRDIIEEFQYMDEDHYSGGGWTEHEYKQNSAVQGFCMSWVERISNQKEKAGAMSYVMKIF